jgi:hypothetical protein
MTFPAVDRALSWQDNIVQGEFDIVASVLGSMKSSKNFGNLLIFKEKFSASAERKGNVQT